VKMREDFFFLKAVLCSSLQSSPFRLRWGWEMTSDVLFGAHAKSDYNDIIEPLVVPYNVAE